MNFNLPIGNKLRAIIITIIILVLIGIGANYFIYLQNKLQLEKLQKTIDKTLEKYPPKIMHDITANWKTYTNRKCQYKVKYPADWATSIDPFRAEEVMYFSQMNMSQIFTSDRALIISSTPLNEIPNFNLKDPIESYESFLWKDWANKKIENINFENINTIRITGNSNGIPQIKLLFSANNCYYQLDGVGSYIPTFIQIISTFNFTD